MQTSVDNALQLRSWERARETASLLWMATPSASDRSQESARVLTCLELPLTNSSIGFLARYR